MPIDAHWTDVHHSDILFWHIAETEAALHEGLTLCAHSEWRLSQMKSEVHRKSFLAVRQLLHTKGYADAQLLYDPDGKPKLNDGRYISISHSHHGAAIVISDAPVGIDLELIRDKITGIGYKFAAEPFVSSWNDTYKIQGLTVIWGVKEALFKVVNRVGISYKNDILVDFFEGDSGVTQAHWTPSSEATQWFEVHYKKIAEFILVWLYPQQRA